MSRSGLAGPSASLTTGMSYGVPPLLKFGSKKLQERFLPDLLLGKKRMCIAITEPEAGSDVANVQTTATRTPDGRHFVVNGTKKWYVEPFLSLCGWLLYIVLWKVSTLLLFHVDIYLSASFLTLTYSSLSSLVFLR